MSESPSLWWIDWRLAGGSLARETIVRFVFCCLLGFALLSILLSGAGMRFLAGRYAITAVLRPDVPSVEAEGLAKKIAALPPVRSASYRDPETAWREFLRAYPGLEPLRASGGNPIPGYIEIRIRPDRMTGADIGLVTSALRPVSQVDKVLSGEDWLPSLLRTGRFMYRLAWAVFGVLVAVFFLACVLQERGRALSLAGDFAFLAERGIPAERLAGARAGASAVTGFLLALAGSAAGGAVFLLLLLKYPSLEGAIGSPSDLLLPRTMVAATAFSVLAALLSASASYLGFRAARPGRK